jgi:hypothetical protein
LLVEMVVGDDDQRRCCGPLLMARRILGTGVPVGVGEDDPTWWRCAVGEVGNGA